MAAQLSRFVSLGGVSVPPSRRRRPTSSKTEAARRKLFGQEWGRFMHEASRRLQEEMTK